ncbi:transposase [Streptomyces sp. NPDC004752]
MLRSLPRDTAAFTDRVGELERLMGSVRASQERGEGLPVHADGMPGVGKTTFAVHAGHLLSERFPDGQLFVNLNGYSPGRTPVQAGEALASLLAAAGVPTQQIPVGDDVGAVTEARAAMWRSRLAGKKALLILDNAASYRQLEPLLPGGSGCLVLVTSRRRLVASEEVVMSVEALPPDHAVDLFVRLSGRPADGLDRGVVDELVRLRGCLPLGVSLLAARLRHHPSWTAEDLCGRLVAARDRLGELRAGERAVTATFDLSYRDLAPERQRFFRQLGFFPGTDLDAHVGAALGEVPVLVARRHLEALYDDHLIDEQPVVDVPSTLSARARLLATGGDRKTDARDALHVAQVALFRHDLRPIMQEDQTTILRLLTERRDDLVHERTRVLNRLHAVLRDLLPGGAPTGLSADKAATLMKGIRPVTATDNCHRDIARDLLADLRRLDRQVKDNEAEMREAVAATRTTLTTLPGLGTVLAAKAIDHIGDISRFPTEHHFASYTGSAPLDASSGNNIRHRLNTGGNRALNSVLHTIAVCQIRDGGRGQDYL